jgi:hypothetical protein
MSGRKRTMCMAEACDRVSEPEKCTRCCTAFCAVHIARLPTGKSACVYCCEGVCLSAMKDAVAKRKTKQAKLSKLRPKIEEFERNHLKAGAGTYEFGQRGFESRLEDIRFERRRLKKKIPDELAVYEEESAKARALSAEIETIDKLVPDIGRFIGCIMLRVSKNKA